MAKDLFRLQNTIKYPTSIIVNGASPLGLSVASSLLEQGGYVIIVDNYDETNLAKLSARFGEERLLALLDYSSITHLPEELRRLDYIFYLQHEANDFSETISTHKFLKYSNYLDAMLSLAGRFEAKFLLTTSIKAHQMLLDSMQLDLNYGKNAKDKHTVYTEMEIQRYAESLTLEYVNKMDLNARILRLGEVIGSGIDLTKRTMFNQFLIAAVTGRELSIKNDGLESDFYVHLMDAAYGIVKAQFSKDTKGEIYTLSYEQAYTHLSVAYLMQDLEPESKEINFIADSAPVVHLQKPAPNLSRIGWIPKIDFEQAVKDSLSAAKLYILKESAKAKVPGDSAIVDKLKSFLSLAQEEDDLDIDVDSGPVSRLIAERKLQMRAKELALKDANDDIQWKTKAKERSPKQKISNSLWQGFNSFKKRFSSLKNVTPAQLLYSILAAVVLIFFYFNVLAPVLALGRNILVISSQLPQMANAISTFDTAATKNALESLEFSLSDSAAIVAKYQGILKYFALDQTGYQISAALSDYALWASAGKDMMYVAEPLTSYLNSYADNIYFRPNSDSYLSSSNGLDYSPILTELNNRKAYLDAAYDKYVQAIDHLDTLEVPSVLADTFSKLNGGMKLVDLEKMNNLLANANALLGIGEDQTYLIAVLDNARLQTAGGSLSALIQMTWQNGAVAEVKVVPIDSIDIGTWQADEFSLNYLKARQFTRSSALSLSEIDQISDPTVFSSVLKQAWKQYTARDVDVVVKMDLEGLESLLALTDGVEVDTETVSDGALLAKLASLQTTNETAERRNDVIAQVSARLLDEILDDWKGNFIPFLDTLSILSLNGHLVIPDNTIAIASLLKETGGDGKLLLTSDIPLEIYLGTDETNISPTRLPALNQATKVVVRDDTTLDYTLTLRFPSISDVTTVGVCGSSVIKDLRMSGVDALRVSTGEYNDSKCITAKLLTETEVIVQFNTIQFETFTNNQYNLVLGIPKVFGAETISDVEVSLSSTLSFVTIIPEAVPVGGKVVFTQNLQTDAIIDLTISKSN